MHIIVEPPGANITVVIQLTPSVAAVRPAGPTGIVADQGHIAALMGAVPTMVETTVVGEIQLIAVVKVVKTITVILPSLYAAGQGRAPTVAKAEHPAVLTDAAMTPAAAVEAPVMTMTIAIAKTVMIAPSLKAARRWSVLASSCA